MSEGRKDGLARLKDHYHSEINKCVDGLVEDYQNIVAAAGERVQPRRENFQIEVFTTNLVQHAESLLKLINELKQSVVLNDFATIAREVDTFESQCSTVQKQTNDAIVSLRGEVESELEHFETHLAESKVRPDRPYSAPPE